jgi:hypothetical protein
MYRIGQPSWTQNYARDLQGETGTFLATRGAEGELPQEGICLSVSNGEITSMNLPNFGSQGDQNQRSQTEHSRMGYGAGQQWCLTKLSDDAITLQDGINEQISRGNTAGT